MDPHRSIPSEQLARALADPARLEALHVTDLLGSEATEAFDRLTRLVVTALDCTGSILCLVDSDRQFFKSSVGLAEPWASHGETPLSHSLCQYLLVTESPLVIPDARADRNFADNLAIRDLSVIGYAGFALRSVDGHVLGSIAALDDVPRAWTERDLEMLRILADVASDEVARITQARRVDRLHRLILDSVKEGIYGLDLDGLTTFVNVAAARMLGWEPDDLIGVPQHDAIHHTRPDGSPYPREACPIYAAFRDGQVREVDDEVFWRKDGSAFPVSYTSTPIRNPEGVLKGAVVTFRDITLHEQAMAKVHTATLELAREQAEREEAERSRARLRTIFEQAPALILMTRGPEHVIELANRSLREFVGGRDILGRPMEDAFPEAAEQGFIALLDQVYESGQPFLGKEVAARVQRDGEWVDGFYNFVYQPIVEDGRVMGILSHAMDVTEQVHSRKETELHASELARLASELERSNRDLDDFAYVVSHDLRAPLRGISTLVDCLEEELSEKLSGEPREWLGLLRDRAVRLDRMIRGVLDLSRVREADHAVESVDTSALIREVMTLLDPPGKLRFEVADGLPVMQADRYRLQLVLMNLLGNAAKHASSSVRVESEPRIDGYRFAVIDDGPGIDPSFHDRIWGAFQQLSVNEQSEGVGLGLAIVRRVVEDQGGRAWVESELGSGACFYFDWPVLAPSPGPAE